MASMPPGSSVINEQSTDAEILLAIQLQQVKALDLLYERYSKLVHSVAMRILDNAEEAEEVTQDTFLRLWQRSEIYQCHRGSLNGFLIMLAKSRSLDLLRARKSSYRKLQRLQRSSVYRPDCDPALEFITLEERMHFVRQALDRISPAAQQLLETAYYEGLSQSEIAKRDRIPLGTVKSRSRLALRQLRFALKHLV